MFETLIISIVFIVIFIFIYINIKKSKYNSVHINSNNGFKFLVYKDQFIKEKINLLNQIINNMLILKIHLIKNKNDFPEYIEYIELLNKNFNETRTNIYETEIDSNLTSYSVNKGEELSVCLRSKKENKLHEINLLMYVIIHEMAHMSCPEIGHGDLFKKIFKFYTEESIKIGIYKYIDYNKYPVEYCGMTLQSSII
jgi:predicted metal-dependent hydrolase